MSVLLNIISEMKRLISGLLVIVGPAKVLVKMTLD